MLGACYVKHIVVLHVMGSPEAARDNPAISLGDDLSQTRLCRLKKRHTQFR